MGELTATHLISSGANRVLVANRTHEKSVALASRFGGQPIKFGELPAALAESDIVIASTGSRKPLITQDMALKAARARRGKPMFFIDIAVPRDVESKVGELDNVFLYNIDDLQTMVDANAEARQAEVTKVKSIIAEEVSVFTGWLKTLDAVPVISALREKMDNIRMEEIEKLRTKLTHMSPADLEAVNAATRSIVNKICHQPMVQIKEYATEKDSSAKLETICEVFGIPPSNNGSQNDKSGDTP
jgi:glutamyl-tRNA reductase